MPGTQNRSDSPRPRRISRRDFLKVAAAGLQLYCDVMASEGRNPEGARNRATPWLRNGAELGVGTDDLDHIDLVEITLG
jgi:hypothetical protein